VKIPKRSPTFDLVKLKRHLLLWLSLKIKNAVKYAFLTQDIKRFKTSFYALKIMVRHRLYEMIIASHQRHLLIKRLKAMLNTICRW